MEIKPIYNTGTITFIENPAKINSIKINSNFKQDPKGVIPNGIYKVFKHENSRSIFVFVLASLIFISQIILISLISTILNWGWFWYIPTSVVAIASLGKLIYSLIEYRGLRHSINVYRDDLSSGLKTTPPFISNIYIKLYKKQVTHNWITIATLFYGTIAVLIFWWLKDVSWWIFDFKLWISQLGPQPDNLAIYIVIGLIGVMSIHIWFTVFRKKRIVDIQSFFGNEVISQIEIQKIVYDMNKAYRKIFFLSILIILIIPIIIKIVFDKIRTKR
ncbi:MAG: MSC_0882 family membrane protein [Metamycoplasmataceae bacterium]